MTKKICFAGAYGIDSIGDDAALVVLARQCRERLGDYSGIVVSRHPEGDHYRQYGLDSIANLEYPTKEQSLGKWFRGFNVDDDRSDLARLDNEIAESSLLVIGAGNALTDYSIGLLKGPVPYFVILSLIAKAHGVPILWFGLSVGPLSTKYGRKMVRLAAGLADDITLRDQASADLLASLGVRKAVRLLPDPVLGLNALGIDGSGTAHSAAARSRTAAVSVRAMPGDPDLTHPYYGRIAAVCDALIRNLGMDVVFVPQCTYARGNPAEDDRYVAQHVVSLMTEIDKVTAVTKDVSIEEVQSLYANADLALCTRLHGCVLAAIEGVPVVAISYNPKVAGFMAWLGVEDYCLDVDEAKPDAVLDLVDQALADSASLDSKVSNRVREGRRQVAAYGDAVQSLINMNQG